jgi:phospholipid/cholesterol/gamma-HCH transport system permease protein
MQSVIDVPPLLAAIAQDGQLQFRASGGWTARNAGALDALITGIIESSEPYPRIVIDMGALQEFDTYGALLLARIAGEFEARGSKVAVKGLAERFVALTDAVRRAGRQPPAKSQVVDRWLAVVDSLRRRVHGIGRDLIGQLNMLGAVGQALVSVAAHPSTFRLTSTVHHLDRVALQAVPIILLITFLIGGIIAQQGFFHFRKFGADQYVVDMVGILVLREIGVLIVAIMVAGRSGSSYTAELGSMKMREEIDALRTMGLDPIIVLILPRIIALVIGLPILTFIGALSALYGGGFIAWIYGDMNPDIFIARLRDAISITHFEVGMIKAPFMALVIGIVACSEGFKVRGSADSLGLQTTASVVKSIFFVIVLDGLFAMYFASIGM